MLQWLDAFVQDQADDDIEQLLLLNAPEASRLVWSWMQATDWKHLPYAGGLLDQPEWLMDDLFQISAAYQRKMRNQHGRY